MLRCCGSVQVDLAPEERTRLLAEYLAVLGRVPDLAFDVSHYNAILKVSNGPLRPLTLILT